MSKKIGQPDIIGQRGINIIEKIVLDMGFLWYPSGGVEAGIDGVIEIRDNETSEVTNCIIQVQSKATEKTQLQAENDTSFEYPCKARDIDYWICGNAPVILIVVKVSQQEAFWISIKEYFNDPQKKQLKKVFFDKTKNRFDVNTREQLIQLAIPKDSGLYLSPRPKKEKLYSNLLQVSRLPEYLYTAYSNTEDESKTYSTLKRISRPVGEEWIVKENSVLSFHNLREEPWKIICDLNTVEKHKIEEWSLSNKIEQQQEFVNLLNKSLQEKVKKNLFFDKKKKCYYFKATNDLSTHSYSYQSLAKKTQRDVFQSYSKKNSQEIAYYRHSAFKGQFIRINSIWFLEITPTYFFTRDGFARDIYEEEHLSGIKRLEKNNAVFGQLVMWADYLSTSAQAEVLNVEKRDIKIYINDSIKKEI